MLYFQVVFAHLCFRFVCVAFEICGTVIFIRCVDILFLALYFKCFARLCVCFSLSLSVCV